MPQVKNINSVIKRFSSNSKKANHRYATYDFCYKYFYGNKYRLCENIEHSCWVLWGYLASWGMLRGSSALLQLSPAALVTLIEYLNKLGVEKDIIWEIDVPDYSNENKVTHILEIYNCIAEKLKKQKVEPTVTLVTKIMMGVFGCIPAFDTMFTTAFKKIYTSKKVDKDIKCKFNKVNGQSLKSIYEFYESNKIEFDTIQISLIDFSGNKTSYKYKIAKLVDMYGFCKGLEIAKLKKKAKENKKNK